MASTRGVAPVVAAVDAGGELIYLRPPRRRPGRERRGRDRQGAHRGDLPPAEQGLRGPGVQRPPVRAAPRARGAAAGRHPDRARRPGHRRDRRQRRLLGRRGPGARARSAPPRRLRATAGTATDTRRFFSRRRRRREVRRPAVSCSTRRRYKIDAGRRERAGRGRVPRARRRRHARRRGHRDRRHRRRDASTRARSAPGELRARARRRRHAARRSARATSSRSRAACPHQFVDVSDPFLYFVVKVEA